MRVASDDSPDGAVAADDAGVCVAQAGGARQSDPERRCILTGVHGSRDQLIRLVVGPDGAVWADLAAKLPGRGAWVVAHGAVVAEAVQRGRLRGAMARAMRSAAPTVPADLADRIADGLGQRALQRLGLEMRAGHLIWGSERLGEWARSGRIHLLLHAADAAADGSARLDQAFRVGGGSMERVLMLPADRLALSSALGRDNMVHVGIADPGAATRVETDVARWSAFLRTPMRDGSGGGDAPPMSAAMAGALRGPDGEAQASPVPDDDDAGRLSADMTHAPGRRSAGKTGEGRE